MKYFEFTSEEKALLFDQLAERYYKKNFGQMSKSDIDLLMFHFYIDKMMDSFLSSDGSYDYNQCSDYRISKELGITQQRVRNLKIKNQLVYHDDIDWKSALARLTENARYDRVTGKIMLNIPDPNLYLEIQNFIEERGAFVEKQLNRKVLQLRAEYYIDLVVSIEPESSRKAIIKCLKDYFNKTGKDDAHFDERNIGKSLINGSVSLTTIASNLSGLISPQNQIGIALLKLLLSHN